MPSTWTELTKDELRTVAMPDIMPSEFSMWKLDTLMMKKALHEADTIYGRTILPMPYPDHTLKEYTIHTVMTVSKELLEAHPELRTYEGVNVNEQRETGRFDYNSNGFHGTILSLNGTILINPSSSKNNNIYICSYKRDTRKRKEDFEK